MATKIYVLTLESEPLYAVTDLQKIKDDCQKWFDDHYDNFGVQQDYYYWLEDKTWYPNTDDGEDAAWCDYIEEQFESGSWGDYAWYECSLK
jgi:hypothetical protein